MSSKLDEIKKVEQESQGKRPVMLNENLFDHLCCFTSFEQTDISDNATTNKRDLYQQMAITFNKVYANLLMREDLCVTAHLREILRGQNPVWPLSFVKHVAANQNEVLTKEFYRVYCQAPDTSKANMLLYFGKQVFDSFKATTS